jgi:hypothetical protein
VPPVKKIRSTVLANARTTVWLVLEAPGESGGASKIGVLVIKGVPICGRKEVFRDLGVV